MAPNPRAGGGRSPAPRSIYSVAEQHRRVRRTDVEEEATGRRSRVRRTDVEETITCVINGRRVVIDTKVSSCPGFHELQLAQELLFEGRTTKLYLGEDEETGFTTRPYEIRIKGVERMQNSEWCEVKFHFAGDWDVVATAELNVHSRQDGRITDISSRLP